MEKTSLTIRAYRGASFDARLPRVGLHDWFSSMRWIIDGNVSVHEISNPGLYLRVAANLGLDEDIITEVAALHGIDFYELNSLCKPGGAWLRELTFESDQIALPAR